uniref:Uncharacterized protein n=1 Tax=Rhizophora mucronata TaxID=61149 RepID=A0A2P2NCG0_RHIMU
MFVIMIWCMLLRMFLKTALSQIGFCSG